MFRKSKTKREEQHLFSLNKGIGKHFRTNQLSSGLFFSQTNERTVFLIFKYLGINKVIELRYVSKKMKELVETLVNCFSFFFPL